MMEYWSVECALRAASFVSLPRHQHVIAFTIDSASLYIGRIPHTQAYITLSSSCRVVRQKE